VSLAAALALLLAATAPVSAADDRVAVIRDAEIEATIRAYATPLFQAAGLTPDDIHVALVESDKINAYVTHGLNLVLYTGLLIRSEAAGQVIGVIAHATGHIAGDHVARLREHVRESPFSEVTDTPENAEAHRRMKSKLIGFLQPLARVLQQYPTSDGSLAARYARAIAYYRVADLAKAIPLVEGLIEEQPDD